MSWMTSCRAIPYAQPNRPLQSDGTLFGGGNGGGQLPSETKEAKEECLGESGREASPFTSYSRAAFCFSLPFPPYPFKSEEEEEERERRFISLMQQNDRGGPSSPFRERKSSGKKGEKLPFLPFPPFCTPKAIEANALKYGAEASAGSYIPEIFVPFRNGLEVRRKGKAWSFS